MPTKAYVILSLNHSDKDSLCFWRPDNSGYTTNPWQAGIYTEEQVKGDPEYYNDGYNTIAICINNSSLTVSGVKISADWNKVKEYRKQNKGQL
jgi:hypothetical protein